MLLIKDIIKKVRTISFTFITFEEILKINH